MRWNTGGHVEGLGDYDGRHFGDDRFGVACTMVNFMWSSKCGVRFHGVCCHPMNEYGTHAHAGRRLRPPSPACHLGKLR